MVVYTPTITANLATRVPGYVHQGMGPLAWFRFLPPENITFPFHDSRQDLISDNAKRMDGSSVCCDQGYKPLSSPEAGQSDARPTLKAGNRDSQLWPKSLLHSPLTHERRDLERETAGCCYARNRSRMETIGVEQPGRSTRDTWPCPPEIYGQFKLRELVAPRSELTPCSSARGCQVCTHRIPREKLP